MAMYQVNYKYIHANGKVRSASIALNAKDIKEAKSKATDEIKTEFDHFEITSCKIWGAPQG